MASRSPSKPRSQVIGVFAKAERTIAEINTPLVKLKTKGEMAVDSHRRKFQTGNFKLSNKHFNWVEDYSIVPDGETRPEWAIIAERVEGGKFYGIPTEFAIRTEREIPSEEAELQEIVQFFDSKNYLLFEVTDAAAKEDPDATAKRAKELLGKHKLTAEQLLNTTTLVQPLREMLKAERQKNVAAFVSNFKPAENMRVDAVFEGSKKINPIAHVKPDDHVVEVQEVFVGSTSAWEKCEEYHQQVRDRFEEWYGLKQRRRN
jgi:hypothetical protein